MIVVKIGVINPSYPVASNAPLATAKTALSISVNRILDAEQQLDALRQAVLRAQKPLQTSLNLAA